LTRHLFGEAAGLLAALAFVCAPALGITSGTWVLPDGPLLVGLLAGCICLTRLLFLKDQPGWLWLAAGFWGGIALLSKYHGIFLFLGTGLFVVTSKNMRFWMRTIWPYAGTVVGLVVFSPVLIWNYQLHWISFAFQGGRVGGTQWHLLNPFLTLLGQILFLTPWIWCVLMMATGQAFKSYRDDKSRYLLCLGIPQILFFTLVSVASSSATFYHWAMPGYMFLFPLLGKWCAQKLEHNPKVILRMGIASSLASLGLIAAIMLAWYGLPLVEDIGFKQDPLIAMRSLKDVNHYFSTEDIPDDEGVIVAPTKWFLAGKFDYALKGRYQVTCFCQEAHQYGIVAPLKGLIGRDFIIPVPLKNADNLQKELTSSFAEMRRLKNLVIYSNKSEIEEFAILFGHNLLSDSLQIEP